MIERERGYEGRGGREGKRELQKEGLRCRGKVGWLEGGREDREGGREGRRDGRKD